MKRAPFPMSLKNLQRFSSIDPLDNDPEHTEPLPAPTPNTGVMPSHVAPEAWANVEAMLVTLSSNTRVQHTALKEMFERLLGEFHTLRDETISGVSELKSTMQEFRQLLADATVEVPEEDFKKNEQKKEEDKKSRPGYLGNRG